MVSLAHTLLYFPIPLIVILLGALVLSGTLMVLSPATSPYLLLGAILLTFAPLINCSYSNPQNWWARRLVQAALPSSKELGWRYIDKSGFNHSQQAIYVWYPHGHLAVGAFGSVAYNLGAAVWKRPVALCAAPPIMDIPALRQVSMGLGLVRSDELSMRDCLRQGTSLVIIPGGPREILATETNKMNLVDGREGFLRLAAATNLPLIPVFAFGENELFSGRAGFGFLETLMRRWHGTLNLPSWTSTLEWLRAPVGSRHLTIKFGAPLLPGDFPKSLEGLATEWKEHVNLHYELLRPMQAPERITWIGGRRGNAASMGAKNSVTE